MRLSNRLLPTCAALAMVALATTAQGSPRGAFGQVDLCEGAERYLREVMGMVAISEPDTIDDWRTHKMVPGCRVTAAVSVSAPASDFARVLYEPIMNYGWVRTPDPRDAPQEASLRYRKDGADCLFNYYDSATSLNTEAEMLVTDAVHRGPGQEVFNVLVMCTPAMPADPRGG